MPPRLKKLVGLAVLLPALGAYFLAAAAFADVVPDHQFFKVIYFLTAGIAWAFPTVYLLRWADAPSKTPDSPIAKDQNGDERPDMGRD